MRLTVAIPTFDRNSILRANLELLLPQLDVDCELLILDNCSPTPVAATIEDLLSSHAVNARLVRHPVNIGGNANVLRALELCETEWLWILGDDDAPTPDAIATVRRDVAAHSRCRYFNYATELYDRRSEMCTHGPVEFVTRMDSFSNALFLSTSLFNAPAMRTQLRLAYTYGYSNAPHLIALLAGLGPDDECILSMSRIVRWQRPPLEQRWSMINAALSFPTLLDAPLPPDIRQALGRKLSTAQPPLEGIVRQLLLVACQERDARNAIYYYDQIRARRYAYEHNVGAWLRSKCYRPLFWAPRLSSMLVERVAQLLLGHEAKENRVQDRLSRL